jgi:membrane-associated HD superfamily phosphohydrolase
MKSLKIPSRLTSLAVTIIIAIITYISTMNPNHLATQLGIYGSWASLIIIICTSIVNHYSEEARVKRAEEIIIQKQNTANSILNESDKNITNMDAAIKEVENETNDNDEDSIEDVDMQ